MNRWFSFAVVVFVPSLAMAGIRCGNRIIDTGTTSAEVAALCGDPTQVSRSTAYRGATTSAPGHPNPIVGSAVEIQIEVWTYNFGPDKLMERIRFEDGVVVNIESLGYGYNEP
jgi:Protein of unknown function (DUF2845)